MQPRFLFYDDYGSGWLWPADAATIALYDVGPLDAFFADRLSADTIATADRLLFESAASLNHEYPPDGCQWPLAQRSNFDLACDVLFARYVAELGPDYALSNTRTRLAP